MMIQKIILKQKNVKFKNEDSVNNDDRIEDDTEEE